MIKKRYNEFLKRVKNEPYYDEVMTSSIYFMKSSTGAYEGLYVFEADGYYYLDYCERGRIDVLVRSQNSDDVLNRLSSNLLFKIAVDYELNNRKENQSIRRILFSKNIELHMKYTPKIADEQRVHYEEILATHPYDDGLDFIELIKPFYDDWDPMGLLAFGAPKDEYRPEINDLAGRLHNAVLTEDFVVEQIYDVNKHWFNDAYLLSKEDGRTLSKQIVQEVLGRKKKTLFRIF